MVRKKVPEIDIKVRGLDKAIYAEKRRCCFSHEGHFWIFGSALAMILSYERSASILWAILHGIFSWFYVLFRAMQIWGWF